MSERKTFDDLGLIEPLRKAVKDEGYTHPTPIQEQAIPKVLKGHDLLACAQTGTGKTAAFALPILQLLAKVDPGSGKGQYIRVLVLTPTRELATQIGDSFSTYGKGLRLKHTVVFGGVGQNPQVQAVRRGVDIMVATPGRLLDLVEQGHIRFDGLEIFVLDEADRMLDMGFIHDVRRIIKLIPEKRQTLFFSATMPPEISRLADRILTRPDRVEVTPVATTAERIAQSIYHVHKKQKTSLLIRLLQDSKVTRSLVFTRTKRDANRVAEHLEAAGIGAAAIHGNKSQSARERALEDIKRGRTRVLVATDIAARGIDIDEVSHVFNYDIPNIPETYVHRIGRTARAGHEGVAVSLCSQDEIGFLKDVEKLIRKRVPVMETPEDLEMETRRPAGRGRRPSGRDGSAGASSERSTSSRGGAQSEGRGGRSRRGRGGAAKPASAGGSRGAAKGGSDASRSGAAQGTRSGSRAATSHGGQSSRPAARRDEPVRAWQSQAHHEGPIQAFKSSHGDRPDWERPGSRSESRGRGHSGSQGGRAPAQSKGRSSGGRSGSGTGAGAGGGSRRRRPRR